MDENKVIVSTEMKQVLVNLRNLEEIYVIMSGVTKIDVYKRQVPVNQGGTAEKI